MKRYFKRDVYITVVLTIGGLLGFSLISLAEEGKWTKKVDMPTARLCLSTSVVDGKIYAIGGMLQGDVELKTVEEYNPVKDTWTRKADMPTPRDGLSTSVVNGEIYAIGGKSAVVPVWDALSTVEVYNPATDKWTKKADMPTARTYLSTCVVNEKIYAIGGALVFETAFSTVEIYDSATDKWTKGSDMPTARKFLSASEVGGKIYAIGGSTVVDVRVPLPTVEEYTPEGWPFAVFPQGKLTTTWGKLKGE